MSTLVQANGYNFVFDAGRGNLTRLTQAGIPLGKNDGIFTTHYHSDHVNGLSDLWMTGYIPDFGGRPGGLDVYGPKGVNALVDGLKIAHVDDIRANEFAANSVVFDRNGVRITSFDVQHYHNGAIQPAVGFRVDYSGRSVLLSGDTIPTPNILKYGQDVDLLVYEVTEFKDTSVLPEVYAHHTNPKQSGKIFDEAKPKLAVYSHIINGDSFKYIGIPDDQLIERTRETYKGPLAVGAVAAAFAGYKYSKAAIRSKR